MSRSACRSMVHAVAVAVTFPSKTPALIQLMLAHSDIKTTQRFLNITDEEMRTALTGVWERRRQLKTVGE